MKKQLFFGLIALAGLAAGLIWFFSDNAQNSPKDKWESIKDAAEWEFERTKDPALGYPPVERLLVAIDQTRQKQAALSGLVTRGTIASPKWRERGPNNIGGRTRVIHIDLADPSRKTVWAGGVAGGLWKTTDIDAVFPQWTKVNDYLENMAVAGLAQDPTNPQIMYMGTGEGYPNWDAVAGLGLFRSTDGGDTWQLLPSTLDGNFRYTREMITTPQGIPYVATDKGVYRSFNQGDTWEKVFGAGVVGSDNTFDLVYASNGVFFVSTANQIFRSETGNPADWQKISKPPIPSSLTRLEIAVCEADPDVIYCIGNLGGGASYTVVTYDGGETWIQRARPENNNGSEFTNGQAWYDLEIAVDPSNCEHVIAGGVPIRRSLDGAATWSPFGQGIHVDQHITVFDLEDPRKIYFGNDGGIYRVTLNDDYSIALNEDKNRDYNVTQYYACAIHPDTFSNVILGGTQDNGSHRMDEHHIASARNVWGGDGFMCHIDRDEPHIMMVSSQYANWGYSLNEGLAFTGGLSGNGGFYTPSDYDSESNILYSQTNDGDFYRWKLDDFFWELVDIENVNVSNVTHIRVDDNVANRVYVCLTGPARLVRVDDAHQGGSVTGTVLGNFAGTIASLDIEPGNPDHLLVTLSNYGLPNNIWESKDGGLTWEGVEGTAVPGNLPDMPVRWGIFNPNDASQAMIATETGVWTTELLDGNQTVWIPPMPGSGMPLVRTDMLEYRSSDKVVLAATHARGMFTTDVFAAPRPYLAFNRVHYADSDMNFLGSGSHGADSYEWDLGDGAQFSQPDVTHAYAQPGEYPVSLTINGNLTEAGAVKILPTLLPPYESGQNAYGGDFEGNPEQYGVHHIRGSRFERGQSDITFKDGARSGENAFVVGLDEPMQPNTHTMLYLPGFDLTEPGIYEFSFWGKWDFEAGRDGFQVEYSTDRGQSWRQLGTQETSNWYNTQNTGFNTCAFRNNAVFFSRRISDWKKFSLDITDLAGQEVAFRFVVRSNAYGTSAGLAIDDVALTRYEGDLATKLIDWNGEFSASTEITVSWRSLPEYFCRYFVLESSANGKDFQLVDTIDATGVTTLTPQLYSAKVFAPFNLYFFRLKAVNENKDIGYFYEFDAPVLAVRRNVEGTGVYKVFPSPFTDFIDVTFNDVVNETVRYDLYDISGKWITSGTPLLEGATSLRIQTPTLPAGVYFLSVQIGEGERMGYKLLKI